ncbi:MAG: SUF system NifU family Fe-S cluster assembly protein [Spirochaetia bacterium]|nr:SUF system NifU family Fe-S cluster assembly protein [Spirochaetia bacterium]
MSLSEDLYKEVILQHAQNPSHRGPLTGANVREAGVNRTCGDELELEMLVENGKIQKIALLGKGCSIHTASGSLMAEAVEGKSLTEAMKIIGDFKGMLVENKDIHFDEDLEELESLRGVQRYPVRVKCATLSWNTLEQALKKNGTH